MTNGQALFDIAAATERRCKKCGVTRPLAMFYDELEKRQTTKTGRATRRPCRVCQRDINQARTAPRLAILAKIKTEAGCADCGIRNDQHPEIFDFDHLLGQKKTAGVAKFLTKGTVEDMLAEVAKCEVVCANCHRIRTWSRREIHWFGQDRGAEPGRRSGQVKAVPNAAANSSSSSTWT